jgi:ribosome biogenesis GTPase
VLDVVLPEGNDITQSSSTCKPKTKFSQAMLLRSSASAQEGLPLIGASAPKGGSQGAAGLEIFEMEQFLCDLESLGWDDLFQDGFDQYAGHGYVAGRIAEHSGAVYQIYSNNGLVTGRIAGRLRHQASNPTELPAVGDWVAIRHTPEQAQAVIHAVLPRKSKFGRKAPGRGGEEQIVAANVDTIFLVTSLNQELSLRRLERYLVLVWEGGAAPVIVLNKSDLCPDPGERLLAVLSVAASAPVHVISVKQATGLEALDDYMVKGKTIALLGSSGVGKSSLINCLAGRLLQDVGPVRQDDDRGRHTTTRRQLFMLSTGAMVIDTPGLREIQMVDSQGGISAAFEDVESLAASCHFRDCSHQSEPGCAVREAIDDQRLDIDRFESYEKLTKEMWHVALKQDKVAQALEKKKWKKLCQEGAERSKAKRR